MNILRFKTNHSTISTQGVDSITDERAPRGNTPIYGEYTFTAARVEDGLHRLIIPNTLPYQFAMSIELYGANIINWLLFSTSLLKPPHMRISIKYIGIVEGEASAYLDRDRGDRNIWQDTISPNNQKWLLGAPKLGEAAFGANYMLVGKESEKGVKAAVFAK